MVARLPRAVLAHTGGSTSSLWPRSPIWDLEGIVGKAMHEVSSDSWPGGAPRDAGVTPSISTTLPEPIKGSLGATTPYTKTTESTASADGDPQDLGHRPIRQPLELPEYDDPLEAEWECRDCFADYFGLLQPVPGRFCVEHRRSLPCRRDLAPAQLRYVRLASPGSGADVASPGTNDVDETTDARVPGSSAITCATEGAPAHPRGAAAPPSAGRPHPPDLVVRRPGRLSPGAGRRRLVPEDQELQPEVGVRVMSVDQGLEEWRKIEERRARSTVGHRRRWIRAPVAASPPVQRREFLDRGRPCAGPTWHV